MTDLSKKNCQACQNAQWCKYIHPYVGFYCPGIELIVNNQIPRKEPLAGDLIGEGYDGFIGDRDYKAVLVDRAEQKRTEKAKRDDEHSKRHDQIMSMPDKKYDDLMNKAIAALAFFGISKNKTAIILRMAKTTIYRRFPK